MACVVIKKRGERVGEDRNATYIPGLVSMFVVKKESSIRK